MFRGPTLNISYMIKRLTTLIDKIDTTPIRAHPGDLQAELDDPNGCVNDPKRKEALAQQKNDQEALEAAIFQDQINLDKFIKEKDDLIEAIYKKIKEAEEIANDHHTKLNGMYQDEEESEEKKRLEEEIEAELKHIEDLVKQLSSLNMQLTQLRQQYDNLQKRANALRVDIERMNEEHNATLISLNSKKVDIILANYRDAIDNEPDQAKKQMMTEDFIQRRKRCDDAIKSGDVAKLESEIDSAKKATIAVLPPKQQELLLRTLDDCDRIKVALVADYSDKKSSKLQEYGEVMRDMEVVCREMDKVEQQVKTTSNELTVVNDKINNMTQRYEEVTQKAGNVNEHKDEGNDDLPSP